MLEFDYCFKIPGDFEVIYCVLSLDLWQRGDGYFGLEGNLVDWGFTEVRPMNWGGWA